MWVTLCGQKVETFYQIIQNKKGLHLKEGCLNEL